MLHEDDLKCCIKIPLDYMGKVYEKQMILYLDLAQNPKRLHSMDRTGLKSKICNTFCPKRLE